MDEWAFVQSPERACCVHPVGPDFHVSGGRGDRPYPIPGDDARRPQPAVFRQRRRKLAWVATPRFSSIGTRRVVNQEAVCSPLSILAVPMSAAMKASLPPFGGLLASAIHSPITTGWVTQQMRQAYAVGRQPDGLLPTKCTQNIGPMSHPPSSRNGQDSGKVHGRSARDAIEGVPSSCDLRNTETLISVSI